MGKRELQPQNSGVSSPTFGVKLAFQPSLSHYFPISLGTEVQDWLEMECTIHHLPIVHANYA